MKKTLNVLQMKHYYLLLVTLFIAVPLHVNSQTVNDNTAPRVSSLERNPTDRETNSDTVVWNMTFNETVNNVDVTDFIVSNTTATVTDVTNTSGNIYSLTVSGGNLDDLNGVIVLRFADDQDITDTSGNRLTITSPLGTNANAFLMDNTAPRNSRIARQTPTTLFTEADTLIWDITFNEEVNNVDITDFNVSGTTATITGITDTSSNGNLFSLIISGGDLDDLNGPVVISFSENQDIEDLVGNTLTDLTAINLNDNTFIVDHTGMTAPRVSSIIRNSPTNRETNSDTIVWDVTFDEAVNNVDATDFTVSNTTATITDVTNTSGNTYSVTVSGGNLAELNALIAFNFLDTQDIRDLAGNVLATTARLGENQNGFLMDNTAPRITSVVRQSPATSPTDADTLIWNVTFTDEVNNVDVTDFILTGTTATITGIIDTSSNGNLYSLIISGGDLASLNGTVTLDFSESQDIQDIANNTITNLTPRGTNNNTFVVSNTVTGINDSYSSINSQLFPNPTKGLFTVNLADFTNTTITVYNTAGQQLKSYEVVSDNTVIDLTENEKGVYLINITNEGDSVTKQIIKD